MPAIHDHLVSFVLQFSVVQYDHDTASNSMSSENTGHWILAYSPTFTRTEFCSIRLAYCRPGTEFLGLEQMIQDKTKISNSREK